jgi:hypothetical protein
MGAKYSTFEILDTPRPLLRMTGSTGSTTPLAPCRRCLSRGPHAVVLQQQCLVNSFYGGAIRWLLSYKEA